METYEIKAAFLVEARSREVAVERAKRHAEALEEGTSAMRLLVLPHVPVVGVEHA